MAIGQVIGNLKVVIGADTASFDQGMAGVKSSLSGMGSSLGKGGMALAAFAAAAVAAGAAIATALVKTSMDTIDAQSRLAGMLGTSVKSVQALSRAADLADISQEALTKSATKLNSELINVARTGSGPAFEALQRLNLSAEDLLKMGVDERFAAIGDRFLELGYSAAQTGDALKELGFKGGDFIDLLATGGGSIRDATAEIERFGIAISDVDAASIENANDAMSRIGKVAEGVGNQIAIRLAPYIEGIADLFTEAATSGDGFGSTVEWAISGVINIIGAILDTLDMLKKAFKGLELIGVAVSAALNAAWAGVATNFNNLLRSMREGYNAVASLFGQGAIDVDDTGYGEWASRMEGEAQTAADAMSRVQGEIRAMSLAPLPSENLNKWVEDVKAKSAAAAQATVDARKMIVAEDDGNGGPTEAETKAGEASAKEAKTTQDALNAKLEQFRGSLEATELSENDSFARRLEQLQSFYDQGMITETEYQDMRESLEKEHQDKLTDIATKAQQARDQLQRESISRVTDTMGAISSALQAGGEDQFGIVKGLSVAMALLKGYEAIVSAYAAGTAIGGPLVGTAFAALAGITTAAQIAQIMSTSSKSSGSPTVAGGGGASTAAAGAAAPAQTLYINGLDRGALFSGDAVRDLAERMIEFQRDGGKIILGQN